MKNIALAICLCLAACGSSPSTPEEAFGVYLKAAQEKNVRAMMSQMDPDRLPLMAMGFVTSAAGMAQGDPKFRPEYEALKSKHGFGDPLAAVAGMTNKQDYERAAKDFLKDVDDLPGLCADYMDALMRAHPGPNPIPDYNGKLGEVTVTGEKASATVTMDNGQTHPLEFVKRGDRWYISPGW